MCFFNFHRPGEFGIVYKGLLMNWNKVPVQGVAVKALKGNIKVDVFCAHVKFSLIK